MGYIAFVLDEKSRARLLELFPPKHPDVLCHHITLEFGVHFDRLTEVVEAMEGAEVEVIGSVTDDKAQALVVMINGCSDRVDLGTFHITHSINRSKGAKPVYSNTLVSNRRNWQVLEDFFISVTGTVQYFN